MAGEDYGTGTSNQNPAEWIQGYVYNPAGRMLTLAVEVSPFKGFTEAGYHMISGDVRQVYHAVIDKLYSEYAEKQNTSGFNMPDHMKMTRAIVKDAVSNRKRTVYSFSIEQAQTQTSGNPSYIDENNT